MLHYREGIYDVIQEQGSVDCRISNGVWAKFVKADKLVRVLVDEVEALIVVKWHKEIGEIKYSPVQTEHCFLVQWSKGTMYAAMQTTIDLTDTGCWQKLNRLARFWEK
jgi:hypothetical protein